MQALKADKSHEELMNPADDQQNEMECKLAMKKQKEKETARAKGAQT
jgi:hypothetical protein